MKKVFSLLLVTCLLFTCFVSCDNDEKQQYYDDITKIQGITREDHENYTIFRFDSFEGRATFKMNRVGLDEGHIYYQYNISEGHIYANFDRGIYDSEESLFFAVAGATIPENSSTFYKIDDDEIAIIFFTQGVNMNNSTKVSGEVKISFVPFEEIE